MSILADLQLALTPLSIPMETGVFTEAAPDQYIVVIPMPFCAIELQWRSPSVCSVRVSFQWKSTTELIEK